MEQNYYESPGALNPGDGGLGPRDKRGRLKAMGIFQIVLGSLTALFTLFSMVGVILGSAFVETSEGGTGDYSVASMLVSLSFYILASVFFFVVGYGSIKARRWVRPVVLAVMWPTFVFGLIGFGFSVYLIPGWVDALVPTMPMAPGVGVPRTVITVVVVIALAVMFVAAVAVPGVHLLVYQSRAVKETCEVVDPKVRWTDRCEASVLGVVIAVAGIGVMQLAMLGFNFIWFFGMVMTGAAAALLCLAEMGIALYIARKVYLQTPRGWWLGLAYMWFVCIKFGVSTLWGDIFDIYESMGTLGESQQAEMSAFFDRHGVPELIAVTWGVAAIVSTLYMLVIKRHFRAVTQ